MENQKRVYPAEFKQNTANLVLSGNRPVKEVASELGIRTELNHRWIRELKAQDTTNKVFPGNGIPRDEEIARLWRETADLQETNEILKKAMDIFVQKKPC